MPKVYEATGAYSGNGGGCLMIQYPCHYCRQQEATTILNRYAACEECAKLNRDHSRCSPEHCSEVAK